MLRAFPLYFLAFTFSAFGLTGCGEAEIENHTRYDLSDMSLSDSLPPMRSPRELTTSDTIPTPELPGNFTEESAMELVYGLYDRNIECSKWICTIQERPAFEGKISTSGHLFSRSAGFFPFKTKNGMGVFLITETLARSKEGWEECHACAPTLGVAEFSHEDNAWIVKNLKKDMNELGAWGHLPEANLVKIGKDRFGILFHDGYTNQGITSGNEVLVGVADEQFKILASFSTEYSNEGFFPAGLQDPGAYAYESQMSFVNGKNNDYYDIAILTSGTRPVTGNPEDDAISGFQETRKFVYNNGRYVLADSVVNLLR